MNDYVGTSHEAIYQMVKKGQPFTSRNWSMSLERVSQELNGSIAQLRDLLTQVAEVWSDGAGSAMLAVDLGAVVDYLDVLSDGLAGQSGSYANLIVQASADLAAAQPPAVLPPPPVVSNVDLRSDEAMVRRVIADPIVEQVAVAQIDRQIAANNAAQVQAGQTATQLDNQYRTATARLTPPPQPPPIVLAAATGEVGAVGGADVPQSVSVGGFRPGGQVVGAGPRAGGWSVAQYLPAGSPVPVNPPVAGAWSPPGPGPTGSVVLAPGAGIASGVAGWTAGGGAAGGGDSVTDGVAPASWSRPNIDPASFDGGIWDRSPDAVVVDVDGVGAAAHDGAGSLVGHGSAIAGSGFDPVTGSAVTAGSVAFGPGVGVGGGSGWETAAGVAGLGALAAGAAYLTRGGNGGVTAASLSGGGIGANGPGGFGVPGGMTGAGGAGGTGGGGSGGGVRGMMPGTVGNASNGLVQGGQIGQAGRGYAGSGAAGTGRPMAPGSVIGGGEGGYRVTWLVEDRDLYGTGPSVPAVINGDNIDSDNTSRDDTTRHDTTRDDTTGDNTTRDGSTRDGVE